MCRIDKSLHFYHCKISFQQFLQFGIIVGIPHSGNHTPKDIQHGEDEIRSDLDFEKKIAQKLYLCKNFV